MTRAPTFDEIFAVMAAASVGDTVTRVAVPDDPQLDDLATKFAIAVNLLLDDLNFRAVELEAAHRVTQMELERLVDERTRELTSANQELQSFAYSVSHDLRAPLRGIDGFSHILLTDHADRLSEDGQHLLQRVRNAAQRMTQLIDDLLELSRLTRAEMLPAPVSLSTLVKSIVADLREGQPEREAEFVIHEGVTAYGDARLLRIALENLLNNAWKFTRNQLYTRIEFGVATDPGKQAFFVRDNGVGFDMSYADKLFGAFQRLHSASEFEGTGIGLATVQRVILRHGGQIWADATVNQGATFYFTLS